ncbi:glycosyltransferase [Nocardia ninae]|uniref:GDP-mannose-dependent alpha-(1-6)-phosphatidylinositol dimannoside mannosyltransferase n=1 Tax=Nocardia ninae NBRC 108245 TaxID=1210091 RepID=A0A511MKX5_9NOCA|nr:glycosyltransferase [Nocardia ninae]GEM41282.1 GDP-mannose-dependent alpha-(1-6)-phosphatidylinositol dimannoside mannosyltransferase [Nocardia ninae NBRC 108245]
MRIVQIANFYTPASGGLRTCLDEIGRGYLAAGHDRVLVVPGPADGDESTVSGRRITVHSPKFGAGGYHVLTARRTRAILDGLRPDVLECSDKLSVRWLAPWARGVGVPLVLFSHERIDAILRTRVPPGFPLTAAADLANRRLCVRAEKVVVTSSFATAEFARIGATNVRRVPLGVDLTTFRPTETPWAAGDPVRLVLVSRLSKEKRAERAIEAVRVLVESGLRCELAVIGDGPLRPRLERLAIGLPVVFHGHLTDRATMATLVANADIAIFPSPAETFGLAVLESLACGTPVVVPDAGAARELVDARGSGIVSDGTPQGLAGGVRQLLTIPAPQRRHAARLAAERFPWSATVTGMLALYADYESPARSA